MSETSSGEGSSLQYKDYRDSLLNSWGEGHREDVVKQVVTDLSKIGLTLHIQEKKSEEMLSDKQVVDLMVSLYKDKYQGKHFEEMVKTASESRRLPKYVEEFTKRIKESEVEGD